MHWLILLYLLAWHRGSSGRTGLSRPSGSCPCRLKMPQCRQTATRTSLSNIFGCPHRATSFSQSDASESNQQLIRYMYTNYKNFLLPRDNKVHLPLEISDMAMQPNCISRPFATLGCNCEGRGEQGTKEGARNPIYMATLWVQEGFREIQKGNLRGK